MQISAHSSLAAGLNPQSSVKKTLAAEPAPLTAAKAASDSFELSQAQTEPTYAQTPRPLPAQTSDDAQPLPASETPLQRTYGDKDRAALLEAWGAKSGDARYTSDYDLDGDGQINAADLAILLGSYATLNEKAPADEQGTDESSQRPNDLPSPSAPEAVTEPGGSTQADRVLAAWNRKAGDPDFDPSLDANGDGVINSADLAAALGGQTKAPAPVEEPAPRVYTADDLGQLLKSWGARSGEERFVTDYDFDADGVISSVDLAQLLGRLAEQKQAESASAVRGA